jgi:arylsulfatase
MTNQAISWMRFQQALTPDKPLHDVLCNGRLSCTASCPKEYIDKYKGKFDDGWDKLREETLERQKQLGLVPKNVKLLPNQLILKIGTSFLPMKRNCLTPDGNTMRVLPNIPIMK